MIKLGLTGGMGCGKSTAAAFFVEAGFRSVDTDAVVHELLATDERVRREIAEYFGPGVLDERGGIDRRKLGARVFGEVDALRWLEGLLHPLVRDRWQREMTETGNISWVVQIPLLFEKKLEQSFDLTVCVGTSAEIQRRRLLRRGLSEAEIVQRISRQLPIEEKAARADFFLLNDGSQQFLRQQVERLCRRF